MVSSTNIITNAVLQRAKQNRLVRTIVRRQLSIIGHYIKKRKLEDYVLEKELKERSHEMVKKKIIQSFFNQRNILKRYKIPKKVVPYHSNMVRLKSRSG